MKKIHAADILSTVITGPDRAYLVSEVSLRLNRRDLTGALSVAYQVAQKSFPKADTFTLDRAAKLIVEEVAEGFTLKRNPRRRTGSFTPQLRERFERGGNQEYRGFRIKKNDLLGVYEVSGQGERGDFMTITEAKASIDSLLDTPKRNPRRRKSGKSRVFARRAGIIQAGMEFARGQKRKAKKMLRRMYGSRGTKFNPLRPLSRRGQNLRAVGRSNLRARAVADHFVQVRTGKGWHTLASFRAKAPAVDYGNALAVRYPKRKIRYFGPGENEPHGPYYGPLETATDSFANAEARRDAKRYYTCPQCEASFPGKLLVGGKLPAHNFLKKLCPGSGEQVMKKNPAPRSRVAAAASRFARFTGHKANRSMRVHIPSDSAGLAIGPVLAVAYETVRDGKREKYLHDFRPASRPTLAASSDGKSLFLLGGAYRFTDRGIVDKR